LNRQKAPADTTVTGFVVDPTWASVQPTANGPLVTTQIDNELAQARAKGLRVKLRVEAGRNAPTWVKNLAGGPVTMQDISASGGTGPFTVPRFWTTEVMAAYDQLQTKLATKYDGNAAIGQVTLNGPMTQFPEPYLRNASDPANAKALLSAGFTVAQDTVAHDRNMQAGTAWTTTPLEVTFNPYQSVTAAKVFPNVAYTITEMQQFRALYGGRAVLANYSISTSRTGDYSTMYAEQKRLGKPIAYQTAIAAKIGNWQQTLDWAVAQGASSVELPREYTTWDQTLLKTYNAKLAAN
jgi:hypothetical protein